MPRASGSTWVHRLEWVIAFAGALPLFAYDAGKAARRIVEACRYGDPVLVLSIQARLAGEAGGSGHYGLVLA